MCERTLCVCVVEGTASRPLVKSSSTAAQESTGVPTCHVSTTASSTAEATSKDRQETTPGTMTLATKDTLETTWDTTTTAIKDVQETTQGETVMVGEEELDAAAAEIVTGVVVPTATVESDVVSTSTGVTTFSSVTNEAHNTSVATNFTPHITSVVSVVSTAAGEAITSSMTTSTVARDISMATGIILDASSTRSPTCVTSGIATNTSTSCFASTSSVVSTANDISMATDTAPSTAIAINATFINVTANGLAATVVAAAVSTNVAPAAPVVTGLSCDEPMPLVSLSASQEGTNSSTIPPISVFTKRRSEYFTKEERKRVLAHLLLTKPEREAKRRQHRKPFRREYNIGTFEYDVKRGFICRRCDYIHSSLTRFLTHVHYDIHMKEMRRCNHRTGLDGQLVRYDQCAIVCEVRKGLIKLAHIKRKRELEQARNATSQIAGQGSLIGDSSLSVTADSASTFPAVQVGDGLTVQASYGPAVHAADGPTVQAGDCLIVQAADGPAVRASGGPAVHVADGPVLQAADGPTAQAGDSSNVQVAGGPTVQAGDGLTAIIGAALINDLNHHLNYFITIFGLRF
jgi:hypothetical protein